MKRKYQELSLSYKEDLEELENLRRQIEEFAEKNSRLENDLLSKNLAGDSQNQPQGENNQSINELFESNAKLKRTEEKTDELKKDIFTKEKKAANLPNDSKLYQDLIKEIEKLKEKLRVSETETKELREKVKKSEEQLNADCQKIQKQINTKQQELEKEKNLCLKENDSIWRRLFKGSDLEEKLERILRAQIDIIRYNSLFANEAKNELFQEIAADSKDLREELDSFCKKQAEITKLEIQLEHAKKNSKVIDATYGREGAIQQQTDIMIASSMPPQLLVGENDKKDNKEK